MREENYYLKSLKEVLKGDQGRFSNYQELPPIVLKKLEFDFPEHYKKRDDVGKVNISLDEARYIWLLKQLKPFDFSVLEIGSSLGYFILRLATEYGCYIEAYEAVKSYAKASMLMAESCSLGEKFVCHDHGILNSDIPSLSNYDLIISLNVLHHAGIEYDCESLEKDGGWRNYALKHLSMLAERGRFLFFQTGNISTGPRLFPLEDAIPYLSDLLLSAGWEILNVGVVEDFSTMNYASYNKNSCSEAPVTSCKRNCETNLVDYFRDNKLVASLPTGLPARPLWFCKSVIEKT
jgi:hypothetical protein